MISCVFFNPEPQLQEYPDWVQKVRLLNLTELKKKGKYTHNVLGSGVVFAPLMMSLDMRYIWAKTDGVV